MKIRCEFCGNMFNDTLEKCPGCGAPNPNVRRAAADQPVTIDGLKQWYAERGLPPAEVTRFFIGENYRKPKAFGIYRDAASGNFIVYKNKANGERAIRYEGTDEAYAVNELLQRLKQEILQQKSAALSSSKKKNSRKIRNPVLRFLKNLLLWGLGICGLSIGIIVLFGMIAILAEPKTGYYEYQGTNYYHSIYTVEDRSWSAYERGTWSEPLAAEDLPTVFDKRYRCKPYYLSREWTPELHCTDFSTSVTAADFASGSFCDIGYYRHGSTSYYHLQWPYDEGWYVWSGGWQPAGYRDLPEEMRHNSLVKEYFLGTECPADGPEDFAQTVYYRDSLTEGNVAKGYYQVGSVTYYHLASEYDEGWYLYGNDLWSAAEELPEEFEHPSVIQDYYYTPEWNQQTQFTDFTDTKLYKSATGRRSNHDSSHDSSYDWSSSDSWDSGSTDWNSDW